MERGEIRKAMEAIDDEMWDISVAYVKACRRLESLRAEYAKKLKREEEREYEAGEDQEQVHVQDGRR